MKGSEGEWRGEIGNQEFLVIFLRFRVVALKLIKKKGEKKIKEKAAQKIVRKRRKREKERNLVVLGPQFHLVGTEERKEGRKN